MKTRVLLIAAMIIGIFAHIIMLVEYIQRPYYPPKRYEGASRDDTDRIITYRQVRPGGPTALAGIQVNDQLIALNGRPVTSLEELNTAFETTLPGDTVFLSLKRSGQPIEARLLPNYKYYPRLNFFSSLIYYAQ